MGTFALDLLILRFLVKNWLILLVCFLLMILKIMTVSFWVILKKFYWNKWPNKFNRSNKIQVKWNQLDWKVFQFTNSRKKAKRSKNKKIRCCIWLHRQNFNCCKCNKWWGFYYFFYKCSWSSSWNSRCMFYFNIFFSNRNN